MYNFGTSVILLFYRIYICHTNTTINLDVVSMFAVLSFTFLAILMMLLYLMYSIDLNE